jgi:hypothetical protein
MGHPLDEVSHRSGLQLLVDIDYDNSSVATETEAAELVRKAGEFHALVEKWVAANHAALTS